MAHSRKHVENSAAFSIFLCRSLLISAALDSSWLTVCFLQSSFWKFLRQSLSVPLLLLRHSLEQQIAVFPKTSKMSELCKRLLLLVRWNLVQGEGSKNESGSIRNLSSCFGVSVSEQWQKWKQLRRPLQF